MVQIISIYVLPLNSKKEMKKVLNDFMYWIFQLELGKNVRIRCNYNKSALFEIV